MVLKGLESECLGVSVCSREGTSSWLVSPMWRWRYQVPYLIFVGERCTFHNLHPANYVNYGTSAIDQYPLASPCTPVSCLNIYTVR